jgi:hypothetical protein
MMHKNPIDKYINLAEPFTATTLGIFKISSKESANYKPCELSTEGFPLEKLVTLEIMTELIVYGLEESEDNIEYEKIEQWVRQMCIRNIF